MNKHVIFFNNSKSDIFFVFGLPVFLSLITICVYFKSLWYGFIFDDLPTIINYVHVCRIDIKGSFFRHSRWISRILNQVTYHYWGINPVPYRLLNLGIHIATGILIFFLLLHLFTRNKQNLFVYEYARSLAILSSMLFLLHPVQTQTVTYITQMRLEGLVTFFIVVTMLLFVYAVKEHSKVKKILLYGLSFFLVACSTGTKEIIIILPLLIILVDWFFIAEKEWVLFKLRLCIHSVYFCIVYGFLFYYGVFSLHTFKVLMSNPVHCNRGNVLTGHASQLIDWSSFVFSQFKVMLHYIIIFIWPTNLSFDYEVKLSRHIMDKEVLIPAFILTGIFYLLLWLYHRSFASVVVFGALWFFIAMLPRTSIFPHTELMCDYKTFPASVGIMIVIAYCIIYCVVRLTKAWPLINHFLCVQGSLMIVQVALCAFLAWGSNMRTEIWSSEIIFWQDTYQKSPKARVCNNYANSLWGVGSVDEAIVCFNQAILKDDWYAEPHVNLATIYQIQNNKEKALEHYTRAITIGEAHPELFNNLGMLHLADKIYDKAESCFKQAINLRPYYSGAHFYLGKLYYAKGNFELAFEHYQKALLGDMPDSMMYYSHGLLALDLQNIDLAISSFEKINKNFKETAFLLGCCYYAQEKYDECFENFAFAYNKNSSNKVYAYNYAQLLVKKGMFDLALPLYEICAKDDDQSFPFAALHAAHCCYAMKQYDETDQRVTKILQYAKIDEIKSEALLLQNKIQKG